MAEDVKVLGMKPESGRWLLVLVGLTIQLCLGAIYAFSVFKAPITAHFKTLGLNPSATEMLIPYVVFLAVFAISMPLAGPYMEKYGPKVIAIVGGLLVGAGWFLASFATSPVMLSIMYGVVGGLGVGIAYGCPIAVSARWFPDKRGLAVGLTVLGFGFSAYLTGKVATSLLDGGHTIVETLRVLGVAFAVISVALAFLLRFPPKGWAPSGAAAPAGAAAPTAAPSPPKNDYTRGEMLKTGSFWGLWICYTIGTLAGLMAIGITTQVGTEELGIDKATIAATFMLAFAACNGGGRPVFGVLTDKLGVRNTAVLSYVLIGAASLLLWLAPSKAVYVVSFCILWACLGGWLAVAPTATATFFGTKDYARNYGVMFTAYGAGAIVGSVLAGQMKDIFGSYLKVFPVVAALAGVGIVLAFLTVKPPASKTA
jgi:MFS family permease